MGLIADSILESIARPEFEDGLSYRNGPKRLMVTLGAVHKLRYAVEVGGWSAKV